MGAQHLRDQSSDPVRTRKSVRQVFFEGSLASGAALALCALALTTNDAGEWTFRGLFSSISSIAHPGYFVLIVLAALCGGRIVKRWLDGL